MDEAVLFREVGLVGKEDKQKMSLHPERGKKSQEVWQMAQEELPPKKRGGAWGSEQRYS